MIINPKKYLSPTAWRYIGYAILAIVLSIVHLVMINFIQVGGLTPDFLLILCIWIAIREGQFTGLFAAFLIGLFFDFISSDVIGTNALSKTVAAFIAGFFYKEGKASQIIHSFPFLIIVLACSFVHNIVYFFFYIKSSQLNFFNFFIKYGIALSFYTTVFATFVVLFKIPRKRY